ncbi:MULTISPECIES: DNA polymerase Y family protein [unclassified Microbacterium]|uniref:Y-family DNA polymerase n=1 Tax=unclassified Microbacterium TaxID=2609290 RepID=UPI000EA91EF1|nr:MULTISPECIES: DNA polymerase Y family protein [unclassified Microbacterium]MBT2486372.1 DNA polymerase Y family protein [Microbacterium sp. ISL-108]RKN69080.1 DNA polymerase Y family protein [Microbacterium sp. CGR2]
MTTPLRVLVLWFPDWPLRAALGAPPHQPTALVHANTVVACTASAREHGVRTGQRRRIAQGLLSSLSVLPHDPARDERAFLPVLQLIEKHAPGATLLRPGLAILRARGISRYHGGEGEAAGALAAVLADAGFPEVRIGVADGPFTAEIAARGRDTCTVVPPGRSQEFLAPYPVQVLRDEQMTGLLLRLGVRTLGEFTALAPLDVRDRFGEHGARLHALASGADSRPLTPRPPDPELTRSIEFETPLGGTDQVAFAVRQTADAVLLALGDASVVCTEVRIDFTDDNGTVFSRTWLHPTCFDASDLVDRVRWQLEALAAESAKEPVDEARAFGGIVAVRIIPAAVDDAAHHQPGLFGSGTDERLHHAVSRVQTMLGHEGVVTAALAGGRWLADRQVFTPWGERAVAPRDPDSPWPGSLPDPLPAEVFLPPRPIGVLAADGALISIDERGALSHEPAHIDGAGVQAWAGPWPVQERRWAADGGKRGHRLQIVDDRDRAWLVFRAGERWWAEGRYR